jgi:hypothetical protein
MKEQQAIESSKAKSSGPTDTPPTWPFPTNLESLRPLTNPPLHDGKPTFDELHREAGDAPW